MNEIVVHHFGLHSKTNSKLQVSISNKLMSTKFVMCSKPALSRETNTL